MADELSKAKGQIKALKAEVSELGRQHEIRGRELNHARKQAAKTDDLKAELADALEDIDELEKRASVAEREVVEVREQLARTDSILEDVAALKRLVG